MITNGQQNVWGNRIINMNLKKMSFQPSGILPIFLNPFYFDRLAIFDGIIKNSKYMNGKLLDFGCGSKPYENLFKCKEYIGLDIKNKHHKKHSKKVDVFYDGKILPFDNESFDSVFSTQSFQYISNPGDILNELNRVLKNGGSLLITVPMLSNITERPFDKYRYTGDALNELLENSGFQVLKNSPLESNLGHIFFHLINSQLCRNLSKFNILKKIFIVALSGISNIFGLLFGLLFKKNPDCYLENLIIAKK